MKKSENHPVFDDSIIKGKRFTCLERCAMCCRLFRIPLFPNDIISIEDSMNIKREQFSEIIRNLDESRILSTNLKNEEIVVLRTKNNGSCIFLDDRTLKCTIYEARPLACRLYPLRFYKRSDTVIEIMLDPMSEMFCGWNLLDGQEFTEKQYRHFWKLLEEAFSSKNKK